MRGFNPSRLILAASFAVCLSFSNRLPAEDKPAAKPAAPAKDILARWKELISKRDEVGKKAQALQKEFATAKAARKQEIRDEFQKLVAQFSKDFETEVQELAPKVFEKDPSNVEAAEMVVSGFFQENKYAQAAAAAEKSLAELKKTKKSNGTLLNMQGVSLFATHQFEKAEAVLKEAEKADAEAFAQLGVRYLESCAEYVKLWKDEQAIRAKEAKADDLPRVKFATTKGDIVIELFENEAPNTVANFVSLVENKKYDGTKFHRVIPTFMAQGGDPNSVDDDPSNDGGGGPGYRIECEVFAKNARKHFAGTMSMAHAGKDTGGSQFFLTHLPTAHLNPNAARQSGHTVFGRVIEGLDVAVSLRVGDKIESATVLRKRDHEYKPKTLAGKKGF
jgi:cyclophilin family peptidyl-prolyl cis-trans isomerase